MDVPFIFKSLSETGSDGERMSVTAERASVPAHIAEFGEKFLEVVAMLTVCRKRVKLAHERMDEYLSKQMKIYKVSEFSADLLTNFCKANYLFRLH